MSIKLDGKAVSARIKEDLRERVARLKEQGVVPGLGTLLVGSDPGSVKYVAGKHADCEEVGIRSIKRELPENATAAEYCAIVEAYLRRSPVALSRTAVLCTLGARGAVYVDETGSRYGATAAVRFPKAEKGAGDTYLGVFLTRRASGWGITESMAAAASAAAAVVRGEA